MRRVYLVYAKLPTGLDFVACTFVAEPGRHVWEWFDVFQDLAPVPVRLSTGYQTDEPLEDTPNPFTVLRKLKDYLKRWDLPAGTGK